LPRRMIIRLNWCGITTTLETFFTLLSAGFIQRAFIIGMIIAVLSSILSVFVVLKRVSLIGDGLAHTAFGGLALGYYLSSLDAFSGALGGYLDVFPIWVAAVVVVLGSVGITKAIRSAKVAGDAAVALFLQLGLAFGIVLLSLSRGFGINLESLLFGSILLVTSNQIILALSILVITFVLIFLFFKELVYTTFDEVQARAAGLETPFFDYLISVLAGIVVIASIPIVGVLLVSALLVLPAVTSVQVSRSFKQTMILSPIFGITSVVIGLPMSIILDTASGATIVLTGLGIFLVVLGAKRLTKASVKSASIAPNAQIRSKG
jgi:zinc transport system permease protein